VIEETLLRAVPVNVTRVFWRVPPEVGERAVTVGDYDGD